MPLTDKKGVCCVCVCVHASVCVLTCKSQVFGPLALTLTLGLAPCSSTACQEEEAVEIEAGSETVFICLFDF